MEEMEKFSDLTEKKSHKGIICAILIVLLVGLIGFGYYYKNKPDVIFKTAANKAYKALNANIANGKSKADLDMAFNISVDGESLLITEDVKPIVDLVNDLLFKFSVYEDLDSNIYKLDLKADYKKNEVINVGAYYENKKAYVNLNDLFDKVIYTDIDLEEVTNKISKADVKVLLEELSKALDKALDKASFTSEKVDLNGSKVTRNKLTINNENKDQMIKAMVDYLKNSDKFIKALVKVTGETEANVKELLNEEVNIPKLDENIVLSMYTKGLNNSLVKASVGMGDKELLTVTETSKNNYEVSMSEEGIDFKCNVKSENENKVSATCSTSVEKIKISYTFNVNVDKNYKLEKPNTSNAVSFENLTEEDTAKIMENLTKKDALQELMGVISSLSGQFSEEIDVEPVEPIEDFE